MFCSNCGKQIPENTKFCSHCGAAQNNMNAQYNQPTQQTYAPQSPVNMHTNSEPKKATGNKGVGIVITIVVIIAAFIIGYFATEADKLKEPTPFDTPSSFEFDKIPSPSIKDN